MNATGKIVEITQLDRATVSEMFELFDRYFVHASRSQFETDLLAKDHAILLRAQGKIVGFSTLQVSKEVINNETLVALYSGDTIIDTEYWATTELQRNFVKFAIGLMHQHSEPLYWLLICSGYRTYRYLPLFFRDFWPRRDKSTPGHIKSLMRELAKKRFGDKYHEGVVGDCNGQLHDHVSPVSERLLSNPHVSFFIEANPGHEHGNELVCLAQITPSNLTRAVRKMVPGLEENADPVLTCK